MIFFQVVRERFDRQLRDFLQFPLCLHMMKTDLEIGFGDVFREQFK